MDRLENKALSAMKQSLRAWLPEIKLLPSLSAVMDLYNDVTTCIAHEKTEAGADIPDTVVNKDTLLLIGPEGGFTEEEVNKAVKKGGQKISLGPYRLRTETAAICLLSIIQQM